nr:hypothetical protein HK105_004610 [Polyrhizophydium stewartii]
MRPDSLKTHIAARPAADDLVQHNILKGSSADGHVQAVQEEIKLAQVKSNLNRKLSERKTEKELLETEANRLAQTYFVAWSLSFYPQAILNWQRKSVRGLSLDFVYLNVLGFLCYTFYNAYFYASPLARKQYRERWGSDNVVQLNDLGFAVHALCISLVTLIQTIIYADPPATPADSAWIGLRRPQLSGWASAYIGASLFGAALLFAEMYLGPLQLIDLLYFLSLVKMGVTLIKYAPQAVLNARLRSTVGWSIGNVLLDFTGGVLSIAQLLLDSAASGDWTGVTGNPVKFGLGLVSVLFDIVFLVQHYMLYPGSSAHDAELSVDADTERQTGAGERQPLLQSAEE